MVSHIVGSALGITVTVLCVIFAALNSNAIGVVSAAIYGATMILLYTMSSIYHGLTNIKAKKVFQVLDHCTIYLLIAGSYTPIALSAIRRVDPAAGWILFGLEWGCAAFAIVFTAIDFKKYAILSYSFYIIMGWALIAIPGLAREALTDKGFMMMLTGGIVYSVGAVFYAIGSKKRYMHNVFHVFVVAGSLLQFFPILFYAL